MLRGITGHRYIQELKRSQVRHPVRPGGHFTVWLQGVGFALDIDIQGRFLHVLAEQAQWMINRLEE